MTDTANHASSAGFSAENEDLLEYRELSRLAIGGMVLGVFSVLAIFTSVLWIIPILAIILSLVAYYKISKSDVLTGKGMALIGMALAAIWLGIGVTQGKVRDRVMMNTSREMAKSWLDLLLEKKTMEAHQLTRRSNSRQPATVSLEGYYQTDEMAREDLISFETQDALKAVREWEGGPLAAKFDHDVSTSVYEGVDYGRHAFQIFDKESGKPLWDVQVLMKRERGYGEAQDEFFWIADSISLEKTYPDAR
ncbi:hypothetical protein C5Y96_06545 [Blastopirellula marina]|uniref:DUF4190 domain-containing protein n=1 Tax=Blastopirellula marina TaxID=124 RepID=A0A2S8FXB7_9BACT|nr:MULTISPECIES: DUF4190 domain-containing protein [Pirellulaceae]PQO36821.1 hypothetical protein C5Y96_06545 [Blastopirellula marina]RCS53536.1 DUF4190 domain-containing protein [Bremerella cremea]